MILNIFKQLKSVISRTDLQYGAFSENWGECRGNNLRKNRQLFWMF